MSDLPPEVVCISEPTAGAVWAHERATIEAHLAWLLSPPWWFSVACWVLFGLERLARVAGRWSPHARRQLLRLSVWIAGGLVR